MEHFEHWEHMCTNLVLLSCVTSLVSLLLRTCLPCSHVLSASMLLFLAFTCVCVAQFGRFAPRARETYRPIWSPWNTWNRPRVQEAPKTKPQRPTGPVSELYYCAHAEVDCNRVGGLWTITTCIGCTGGVCNVPDELVDQTWDAFQARQAAKKTYSCTLFGYAYDE